MLYKEFDEWLVARFDEWDPQGLLCEDNPGREYAPEVSRIMPLLRIATSEEELASRIHGIFVEMFDEQIAGPVEKYRSMSKTIFDEWQTRTKAIANSAAGGEG